MYLGNKFSCQHITLKITDMDLGFSFLFSNFFGEEDIATAVVGSLKTVEVSVNVTHR